MGVIITPPGGGVTYPNITDNGNVVTINPSIDTSISSSTVTIEAATSMTFGSPGGGTFTCNDFNDVNYNNTNTYLNNEAVFIANSDGKIGFFTDVNGAIQQAAIANATPVSAHDRVNDILNVLRNYGLIAT